VKKFAYVVLMALPVGLVLSGCSTGSIIVTVNGEPGAATKLKQSTISTVLNKDASIMTRNAEKSVIAELKREGYKWKPKDGDIALLVDMDFGGRMVEGGYAFQRNAWGDYMTYNKQAEVMNLDLVATEKGKRIWEARISGSGEYLNGSTQQGCVRELLRNHADENETNEERCYRSWWPF
jgi:uncharacterized protein YceK